MAAKKKQRRRTRAPAKWMLGMTGVMVLGVAGLGYYVFGTGGEAADGGGDASAIRTGDEDRTRIDGESASEAHMERLQQEEEQRREQAVEEGTSYIPSLVVSGQGATAEIPDLDMPDEPDDQVGESGLSGGDEQDEQPEQESAQQDVVDFTPQDLNGGSEDEDESAAQEEEDAGVDYAAIAGVGLPQPSEPEPGQGEQQPQQTGQNGNQQAVERDHRGLTPDQQQRVEAMQASMSGMANDLDQHWQPGDAGTEYYDSMMPEEGGNGGADVGGGDVQLPEAGVGQQLSDAPFEVGDVLYGIIDLEVDSRVLSEGQANAVRAEIAAPGNEELDGARVLGSFDRGGGERSDTLVLSWDRIRLNNGDVIEIEGYGVDPNTPSVRMDADVNYHTFRRWGGLVASSFLEGFGDAISRSGSTQTESVGVGGTAGTVTFREYSLTDEAWIAAGNVGQRLADPMAEQFQIPPTITLPPNSPVGILVMDYDIDQGQGPQQSAPQGGDEGGMPSFDAGLPESGP